MFRPARLRLPNPRWLLWVGLGLFLRLVFIYFPRTIDDDTQDYLELGKNLLRHGVYGLGSGDDLSPSLFRLPGYPIVLAVFHQLFGGLPNGGWMVALYLFQTVADIGAGVLLAVLLYRMISPRAGEIALALAMLCPFTAAESGTAMTECLSTVAVALGIYAACRALLAEQDGRRDLGSLLLAGGAAALAMLLRPDGAVLSVALAAGLFFYILRVQAGLLGWIPALRHSTVSTAIFCLAALLPQSVWTLRNWQTFHVFQPLAPRFLGDPGERANVGVYRWLRTWTTEYTSTATVFWQVGVGPIDANDLPARAFDSEAQQAQTVALLDEYNHTISISADLDHRFAMLADERIHSHPFRYFLWLPALRAADMLFRPRTEEFRLNVFWWNWSGEPGQTLASLLLGLVNLGFVVAAAWGFLRGRVPWPWMLGGYLLLRFALLGTMENPEPRYTVQCFPIFFVAAAAAFGGARRTDGPCVRQSSTDLVFHEN
jgi:hypothetical protein